MFFCHNINICRNLRTFWKEFGKKVFFFCSKTAFCGQEMHYYMVYIAYNTELNLQICNYAPKRRTCRENSKYAPDENFCGQLAFNERLPTSATSVRAITLHCQHNFERTFHLWCERILESKVFSQACAQRKCCSSESATHQSI